MRDQREADHTAHLRLSRRALGGLGVGLVTGALTYPATAEARAVRGRTRDENGGTTSPLNRRGLSATSLRNGLVLVAGGIQDNPTSAAQLLDPQQGVWFEAAPMNGARTHHAAALLSDGRVLVSGGLLLRALSTAEIYDPETDAWTTVSPMNLPRTEHAATAVAPGGVLVTGGSNGTLLSTSELYDAGADRWTIL